MQGQFWLINSPQQAAEVCKHFAIRVVEDWDGPICWKAKKYTEPRTLSQNALYQAWAREYAAKMLSKKPEDVTEVEHEAMKYTLQRHCYAELKRDYLITTLKDFFTGQEKPGRASTAGFSTAEMFEYMSWIQARAADDGLILEAKGEFAELKEKQNG